MRISNEHNLASPRGLEKPYGIRVTLNNEDPFRNLIDAGWEKFHWFRSESERDSVFDDMRGEHRYSRKGDRPSLIFEKVSKSG